MTETQFAIIVGTIFIAPHANRWYGLSVGLLCICAAVVKGLGLV